jgi:hypothetical protein
MLCAALLELREKHIGLELQHVAVLLVHTLLLWSNSMASGGRTRPPLFVTIKTEHNP